MKTILVIDDEPRTRIGIKKTLETWADGKLLVETATSGVEALEWLAEHHANIIITDICMPKIDGLQMLESIAAKGGFPTVIVISGHADFAYAKRSLQLGVFEYLVKPIEKSMLIQTVERALVLDTNKDRLGALEKIVDPKLVNMSMEEDQYNHFVSGAIKYIESHINDADAISMKQVALYLHLNPSYFSVMFKDETGLTFSEYLTKIRLQKAKELLLATDLPIWDISEKVGYSTDKYFIKVFKENEGFSPKTYRKNNAYVKPNIQ